jgi:uncharacterized protein
MRTYERNGVHVDQCTDCRGIFLDRGELERLIDAENAWHDQPSGGTAAHLAPSSGHATGMGAAGLGAVVSEVLGQARGHKQSGYDQYGRSAGSSHRKKSFMSQLFD